GPAARRPGGGRPPAAAGLAWAAPAGRVGEPAAGAAVGGRLPGKVTAEEQEAAADEEEEAEEGLAGHEAPVGEPEDPGREETEPDEGGGEDAKDGADHVEDAERGDHRQPDAQGPAGAVRGTDEVAAPGRVRRGDR